MSVLASSSPYVADSLKPSNDMERRLNELSLKSLNLTSYVARPGFGQQGKPISVLANVSLGIHFES